MDSLWAGGVVGVGVIAWKKFGDDWHDRLADVNLGYDSTNRSSVVGTGRSVTDGGVDTSLLAWLYELFRHSREGTRPAINN